MRGIIVSVKVIRNELKGEILMAEVIKGDAPAILNRLIAEKGLRKEYVAKQLGIRPSNLSDRLSGRVKFDADFAFKVSKVLGVDVKIFLTENYSKWIRRIRWLI